MVRCQGKQHVGRGEVRRRAWGKNNIRPGAYPHGQISEKTETLRGVRGSEE